MCANLAMHERAGDWSRRRCWRFGASLLACLAREPVARGRVQQPERNRGGDGCRRTRAHARADVRARPTLAAVLGGDPVAAAARVTQGHPRVASTYPLGRSAEWFAVAVCIVRPWVNSR